MAWLSVPNSSKFTALDPAWTYVGAGWVADGVLSNTVKSTTTQNDHADITLTGDTIYISGLMLNYPTYTPLTQPGQFTVTIDGILMGTYNTQQGQTTCNSRSYSPLFLRYNGLGNIAHAVVIKKIDASAGKVYVNWAAGISTSTIQSRTVFAGNTLRMTPAGYIGSPTFANSSDTNVSYYNTNITSMINILRSDNLKVFNVDTNASYNPNAGMVGPDNIHPNDIGQHALFLAYLPYLNNTENGNWTLNEGTSNFANDSSGFNNNGTLSSTPPTWATNLNNGSVNGTALSFLGNTNVTMGNGTSLNFTWANPFTFSLWIKTNQSNDPYAVLLDRVNPSTGQGYVLVLSNGLPKLFLLKTYLANAISVYGNGNALNDGKWHYLTVSYNGNKLANGVSFYVDNSQYPNVILVDALSSDFQTEGNFSIDDGTSGFNIYNGTIDEVKAFNYVINTSERTTEYQRFQPVPSYPVGNITLASSSITNTINVPFSWHDTVAPLDYIDVATDSGFANVVSSQVTSADSATITLAAGNPYYWRIRQYFPATGAFGKTSATQIFQTAQFAGFINVNVVDELTFLPVYFFNATLYNGTVISKSSGANAYVNFTSSDIIAGQYQLVITPNSSYAERAIIVNSPGNYTVYLPSTLKTVDFVAFYLLDYTGRFPYASSNLTITKGVNITHSQLFDSDAKVATNLIRGERYTITVYNPSTNNIQQWGDYFSVGTGSVQVVVMNLGVNGSILQPYVQQINASSSSIDVSWSDRGNVLNWVNISVYKDNTSTMVYSLNTTIGTGTASYIITDLNATYFTVVNASTTIGYKTDTNIFDLRKSVGLITNWAFGNFVMPDWVKNAFAIIIMFMLAGSFGAMHRGEGAVVTGIMGAFLWWYNILNLQGAIASLFGALILFSVLYHLETKRRQGGYY